MAIKLSCVCGARFKVDDRFGGRRANCPVCGHEIAIPIRATEDADQAVERSCRDYGSRYDELGREQALGLENRGEEGFPWAIRPTFLCG